MKNRQCEAIGTNATKAVFKPPKPIKKIKEELAELLLHRPFNNQIQELTEWTQHCDRLRMWIELDESQEGVWK